MSTETADISLIVSPKKLGYLFQKSGIPATVYHSIILYKYGPKIYEWDPVTVDLEIEADFGVNACIEVKDKLHAILAVMPVDTSFHDPHAFGAVVHALNDLDPGFEMFDPITPEETCWATYEMLLNSGEHPNEFGDEVKAYVRTMLMNDGYFKCPKYLSWCDFPSYIDLSKYTITEEAKKIQQDKLDRIEAYIKHRKDKMFEILKQVFPKAEYS